MCLHGWFTCLELGQQVSMRLLTPQGDLRTSSATSRMPCWSHSLRKLLRKPGGGVRNPPSPRMGSRMMAAVSEGAVCIFSIHSSACMHQQRSSQAAGSSLRRWFD